MRVDIFDSMDWLYPDSQVRETPVRKARLECARGTRPGFQVLVTGVAAGTPLRFEVVATKQSGPLADVELFELLSVPVEENTGINGFTHEGEKNEHVTRRAPFRVFDAVKPRGKESPAASGANAILVQAPVPVRARPGVYFAMLKVQAGRDEVELPVELRVHKATVPARGTLKVTNWFSVELMAERHSLKPLSAAHWKMIRRYADMMVRNRQSMFWAPMHFVAARKGADGRWRFNFSRWERLVRTFLDAGMTWIEGGHVAGRPDWNDPRFCVVGQGKMFATDPEGYAYLAALLMELRRVIERNGWKARYAQHVADEPHGPDIPDYRILCGIVRKFLPGVPLIDAIQNPAMGGTMDIWVPLNSQYELQRAEWEPHRAIGDEIWHYTCCVPGGKYLNRLLDQSLLRPRLLHWGNYVYDLTGFLHWGLNHYRPEQNPFEQSVVGHGGTNKLPAGDTHIVYPGTDGPWSSMRFEAMREGIEDYELLRRVASGNRKRADAIARQVFRGFADYTEDAALFRRTHAKLLEAADAAG